MQAASDSGRPSRSDMGRLVTTRPGVRKGGFPGQSRVSREPRRPGRFGVTGRRTWYRAIMRTSSTRAPSSGLVPRGLVIAAGLLAVAAARPRGTEGKRSAAEREARAFLETISALVQPVSTVAAEAGWTAATDVTPEHTGARAGAEKAAAAVVGSPVVITRIRTLLAREKDLDELTARQLHKLLLAAAESPGTIPEVVAHRIEAEGRQASALDGYAFCLPAPITPGDPCRHPVTVNDLD